MKLFAWLLALVYFGAVLVFAVNNAAPVPLRLTSTLSLGEVPLVVVVLVCFVLGIALGLAAMVPTVFRLKREVARLARTPRPPSAQEAAERLGDRLASAARNAGAVGEWDGEDAARR
ncbi:MAG: lipopolysaccharide assembly protein LapA domain-containing protein [Burkholderiales bacterium]|jgi:putative membrane protein|nr:lipopolysaccharide assembly protein LapA domain-containing protein [Burkholderiales bacterium]